MLNKLQTLVTRSRGLSHRNANLSWLYVPASTVHGFKSEAPLSYIQTSLFTWRPSSSKMNSVAVHMPCMPGYQTTVESLNKRTLPFPHFLFAYKRLIFLNKSKMMVQLRRGECEQCKLTWELSCAHFPLQVLVWRVHISALIAQTSLQPMLPACLPTLAHPFKTCCPSPQRCPLSLCASHSAWTSNPPHISAALRHPLVSPGIF